MSRTSGPGEQAGRLEATSGHNRTPTTRTASGEAGEAIHTAGLILVPSGGGDPITDLLIRINGETARFRH
nr:hypothetical protein KPHV_84300 [Kitasatospora purpeofusca]